MKNILFNDFIIDASIELKPRITISPFNKVDTNLEQRDVNISKEYFFSRFKNYKIFPKARNAIYAALNSFNLNKDDVVSIFTTSGNFYISSCVTKEIEKICKWTRDITDKTKVIFINHEFGYPMRKPDYQRLVDLKNERNLKLIEDCAHTFFSESSLIGDKADYVIYSLPKSFPMQIGSVLSSKENIPENCICDFEYNSKYENYILSCFAYNVPFIQEYKRKQIENYYYLKKKLNSIGIIPYFNEEEISEKRCVPNVFLAKWYRSIDFQKLKDFLQANGVEASVFYGTNAFFIPCNYNLTTAELNYIIALISYFNENMRKSNDSDF